MASQCNILDDHSFFAPIINSISQQFSKLPNFISTAYCNYSTFHITLQALFEKSWIFFEEPESIPPVRCVRLSIFLVEFPQTFEMLLTSAQKGDRIWFKIFQSTLYKAGKRTLCSVSFMRVTGGNFSWTPPMTATQQIRIESWWQHDALWYSRGMAFFA